MFKQTSALTKRSKDGFGCFVGDSSGSKLSLHGCLWWAFFIAVSNWLLPSCFTQCLRKLTRRVQMKAFVSFSLLSSVVEQLQWNYSMCDITLLLLCLTILKKNTFSLFSKLWQLMMNSNYSFWKTNAEMKTPSFASKLRGQTLSFQKAGNLIGFSWQNCSFDIISIILIIIIIKILTKKWYILWMLVS